MMLKRCLLLLGLLSLWATVAFAGQPAVVYKVDVKDEIGPGVWRTVKKSFEEAEKAEAGYILIDMNTYGGLVVYADSLRSLILNSRRPGWGVVCKKSRAARGFVFIFGRLVC